jgi:adenosylcobinamide-phosphate synthase
MTVPPAPFFSLPIGAALDAALGDPRGWPHPVRAIGWLIGAVETALRGFLTRRDAKGFATYAAGAILAITVIGSTSAAAALIVLLVDWCGDVPSLIGRSLLIYWGLAAKSLGVEARRASETVDLATARRELAMIVGRDTDDLDRGEICRACVETVAENTNDAVVAPLFWFTIGGPIGLWAYKAISTLDSMVGYRNETYRQLGWASARLDDLVAFVPARATWLLMTLAALVVGERPVGAVRIGWRDGRKHPSPNAGWGEATMAGALGVRLGGVSTYQGARSVKLPLGDPGDAIDATTVRRATRVMRMTAILAAALAWGVRGGLMGLA